MLKRPLLILATLTLALTSVTLAQDAACDAGFRLFDHELLATEPVCIPENPERVALVDEKAITACSLGVLTVTNNVYFDNFADLYPFALNEAAQEGMVNIGYTGEPNLEAVLSAEPDLIISATWWEQFNDAFARIAPTVVFDYEATDSWLQKDEAVAQVLGRAEAHEALVAELDARTQTLRDLLSDTAAETTYTVFRTTDARDNLQVFTTFNFGAQLVQEVGLTMSDTILTPEEAARVNRPYWYSLSLERLGDIDADHVFFLPGWEAETQEEFLTHPLWQDLSAVQEKRVHFIGATGEHWIRENVINAHRVLDDLFVYVAGVDPAEVSPNPFADTYQQAETP